MLIVTFFSWMCVSWVPEIMARAEAITSFQEREENRFPLLDQHVEEEGNGYCSNLILNSSSISSCDLMQ